MLGLFNTAAKQIIRTNWAKPILAFLHQTFNKKLVYLGLPDEQALDIMAWIDHLEAVYAFQCREYPKPSEPTQSRQAVLALEKVCLSLNRKGQLTDFQIFDGYLEEVILRGFDNSPTRKDVLIQDIVTVYNLDFCSQIASPLEYRDREGNKKVAYKFSAVKRLLEIQSELQVASKKFILFLTIHCSYSGGEFSNFMQNPPDSDLREYIESVEKLPKGAKAPYLLKAFVYHSLKNYFTAQHFLPEFLPVLHYKGDNDSPMLFFTVIGTQIEDKGGSALPLQRPEEYLGGSFIGIDEQATFINHMELNTFTNNN
jgi:hypothetical protein